MKYHLIEVIALDWYDHEEYRRDFDSVKEAKAFVKSAMLEKDYWDRSWTKITTVRLLGDGEVLEDWFPFGNAEIRDLEFEVRSLSERISEDESEAALFGDGPVGSADRLAAFNRASRALDKLSAARRPAPAPVPVRTEAELAEIEAAIPF